jgi:hypothetical protein
MTPALSQLADSVGSMMLTHGDELGPRQGKGFLVRTATGPIVMTAGHLALRFTAEGRAKLVPPSAAGLCDLATHLPLATGPAAQVPRTTAEAQDPATDVMVFGPVVLTRELPLFELADHAPQEFTRAFVITELRGGAHRGRVHSAVIVKVFPQGSLIVDLDGGLTREEAQACSGSPIVDEAGRVIGLVTSSPSHDGRQLMAGPTVSALHAVLGRAAVKGTARSAPVVRTSVPSRDAGATLSPPRNVETNLSPPARDVGTKLSPPTRDVGTIYTLSFMVGCAVTALVFVLHASFEYDRWYPRAVRRFINQYEIPFLVVLAISLTIVCVKIANARRWFTRTS